MKSILRGIILFFITFTIGSLFTSFYFLKKDLPLFAESQHISNNISQSEFLNRSECADPIPGLIRMKIKLTKERSDLMARLVKTEDLSKTERSEIEKKLLDKRNEIEEMNVQIETLKRRKESGKQNPESNDLAIKLLHKEPCYDF